ncbi:MAG: hypothetical protein ACM3XO_10385 [Bacteroidota bacterium]
MTSQIEETLTADQMQVITSMNITQKDVFTAMQGVTTAVSGSASNTVSVPSGSSAGADMPAGGPPADGGMAGDMAGVASTSGTSQTQGAQSGTTLTMSTHVPTALVEAVIQSLQQIIAA